MSRPDRSTMVPPMCRSTMPAPALMTTAMAAITANAANRLPLTPHLGRKLANILPMLKRTAITDSPDNALL